MIERHERIALSFSGGKDSLAVVYLLREHLDRITIYHCDTGDLLPEQMEIVQHVEQMAPRFVRIETHVNDWIARNGLPTDLLPHSAHPVGQMMGEGRRLVARYDCCYANLMEPTWRRVVEDGNTLMIRGTKRVDMPTLPAESGSVHGGVELWYPLADWTNEQVFAFLREQGAPISRVYDHVTNSPECARCSAWWGEKRNAYLKRFHPALWVDYRKRMEVVRQEVAPVLDNLTAELAIGHDAPTLPLDQVADTTRVGVRVLQGHRLHSDETEHVKRLMAYMSLPEDAVVADIGCGTGAMADIISAWRPDLRWILLNASQEQLKQAPERFDRRCADMHQLPVPDAAVDVSILAYSLCHGDHFRALREAARITKLGGSLFVYDYERLCGDNAKMEQRLYARAYNRMDIELLAAACGWRLEFVENPSGDSSMFRALFNDPAEYDAIFSELRPAIWRFVRN